MGKPTVLVKIGGIQQRILLIRGIKVLLDADPAGAYGVSTRRLNEQVRRNPARFPRDFVFQLTAEEKAEVVANCDHLEKLKFSRVLPLCVYRTRCHYGGKRPELAESGRGKRLCRQSFRPAS